MSGIKVNQALTQTALYFDPDNKDVSFPELMPIFHNKHLNFPEGNPFGRIPRIEGRAPGHVFFDRPKGVEILNSHSVRLTCYAPGAREVKCAGLGGMFPEEPVPMEPLGNGYFTRVIDPAPVGFNCHRYFADGNEILNPLAPIGFDLNGPINYFEMPEEGIDFYYIKDVPHGTIHMNQYRSEVTGETRVCYVYTPPCYDEFSDHRYPVLYLQHGAGQNENDWIFQGKINYVMDNLLAENKAEPVIIVMNNGYALPKNPDPQSIFNGFSDMLVKDCIPFIDSHYKTVSSREGRAMAGLSMGGMQTQATVFRYPELFSALGMFSSGAIKGTRNPNASRFFTSPEEFNSLFSLGFVTTGDQEAPIFIDGYNEAKALEKEGYNVRSYATFGYHEWNV